MTAHYHPKIVPLIRRRYDSATLAQIREVLDGANTLRIPVLPTGLFAAAATNEFSKGTNYHSTWVRDTVHVAYAHLRNGRSQVAVQATSALGLYFATQRPRFEQIIRNPELKVDAMRRPHVRFNGDTLTELQQQWSHAQNDALGYFLWLASTLVSERLLTLSDDLRSVLGLFPDYFRAIEYWHDEDSGHWEEIRKISASSIGCVVAGLQAFEQIVPSPETRDLIARGRAALDEILPEECTQADPLKHRSADAALLFLIYPLRIVARDAADMIIRQTVEQLLGQIGIRRYRGDSFYCANYESLIAARNEDPTRDFSNDLAERNRLAQGGGEAEWCIFDSTLSTIYGERFAAHRKTSDLELQTHYFNRAMSQLTRSDPPRCGELQCPELYYRESDRWQTSRVVPLLWSQANLWTALELLSSSTRAAEERLAT